MKFSLLLIAVFSFGIASAQHHQPQSSRKGVLLSLKKYRGNDTLFKAKSGAVFQLSFVPDEEADIPADAPAAPADCNTTAFAGTDRKKCKTSIAPGAVKTRSLASFLSMLPSDSVMMANSLISKDPNNPRVAAENNNVKLTGIFLFAIKRENDNDYHMIIGDKQARFFNVEISGLPPSTAASFQKLKNARKAVDDFFGTPNCNTGGYAVFRDGIKIQVTGSTFYDIDHAPGVVGPAGFKPATSWEIHPVTLIKFLQ